MNKFEKELLTRIEKLERENRILKEIKEDKIPIYQYSKIKFNDLRKLVDINESLDHSILKEWLDNHIKLDTQIECFLLDLIEDNKIFIKHYNEEELKIKFITKILNKINFKSLKDNFRDFYEHQITYETEKFIFTGTTDFVISKGLFYSQKPYFFIQEFKKGRENSDPEPQLLAELISAIELNNWKFIKGTYIVGANWNFVILEKLRKNKYKYFVSEDFNSTKFEDLKGIYRNLLFVKNEIIKMRTRGE